MRAHVRTGRRTGASVGVGTALVVLVLFGVVLARFLVVVAGVFAVAGVWYAARSGVHRVRDERQRRRAREGLS